MRRIIVVLVVLFACFSLAYAGTKITDMTAIGSLELTDVLEVVDDPGGSPLSRKATFQQVADVVSTDTDIADAISKKHTQNTDTGTTSTTFQIDSGNTGPKIKNNSGVLESRNAADNAYADFTAKDITGETAKLSDLTDGKIPYHVDDATGLADGPTKTDVDSAVSLKHTAGTDTALGAVGTKNPPIDDDLVLYRDSTSSDALVTSTWTQIKAFLKTYFDTQYDDYTLEAHKDTHDPEDGSDALDTAAPAEIAGVQAAGEGSAHSFARSDHAHQIQHGITDNHIVTIDSADVADDEYARFTADGLEGRSVAEVLSDLGVAAGADVTADNDPKAHAASHAVSGADTVFPADPDADRYLQWDDDLGQLVWAEGSGGTTLPADPDADRYLMWDDAPVGELVWVELAGGGDVTGVGDCADGDCLDGSSDGGTYVAMYDGDSNYTKVQAGNSTVDLTFTLPTAYPAASDYLLKSSDAGVLGYTDPATFQAASAALASIAGLAEADASIVECTADNAYAVVTSGGNSYILGSKTDNSALEFKTPANAFAEIKQAATDAATGVVELATTAEIDTGTDTGRAMTPDAFNGSIHGLKRVILKITDDSTALTTGDGKLIITAPPEWNGMNVVDFDICISTASSSGLPSVAFYNVTDSCDILSTNATIDESEYSSYTATTAPVIDTSHDDLATGDRLRIDIDTAGTGAKGLEIHIGMRKP